MLWWSLAYSLTSPFLVLLVLCTFLMMMMMMMWKWYGYVYKSTFYKTNTHTHIHIHTVIYEVVAYTRRIVFFLALAIIFVCVCMYDTSTKFLLLHFKYFTCHRNISFNTTTVHIFCYLYQWLFYQNFAFIYLRSKDFSFLVIIWILTWNSKEQCTRSRRGKHFCF